MGFTRVSLMTNDVKHVLICHVYSFVKRLILTNILFLLFLLDSLIKKNYLS